MTRKLFAIFFACLIAIAAAQAPPAKNSNFEPALPVVNDNACPFEGCAFRKWIASRDVALSSTWKEGREPVTTIKKGQVVTGLTGVHVTFEPGRAEVLQPIPELGVQPGDVILLFMNHGEGFMDIWAKGRWWKEYDCSLITDDKGSGCIRNCAAKLIANGRKEWWVQVKTSDGLTGWAKARGQFDCMDMLGGDEKCEALQSPANRPH